MGLVAGEVYGELVRWGASNPRGLKPETRHCEGEIISCNTSDFTDVAIAFTSDLT